MKPIPMRCRFGRWLAGGLILGLAAARGAELPNPLPPIPPSQGGLSRPSPAPNRPPAPDDRRGRASSGGPEVLIPQAPSLLAPNVQPIDLNTALQLADVQNPDVLIARQRVVEAVALRQFAAAQILPTINPGMNYDSHTGVLQQSNGNILSVNRSAIYVGAGANAIAAGTVNIPGVVLTGNVGQGIYAFLSSRQVVRQREFANLAIRNQAFLQVALAYSELLRAEGRRAVADQVRREARQVADLTRKYAEAGQGRKADADRAATELAKRETDFQRAEEDVLVSSARLAAAINVDPSIRLHPTDAYVVPCPLVPDPMPIQELIALGLLRRPELAERRAAIQESFLLLEGAKVLPFSPTVLIGFSAGGFGGGSNLVRPVFGAFGGRSDFDVIAYWSIQNMGVGNMALINIAKARLGLSRYQEIAMLDRVRAEVAEAYAKTHARYAQISITETAVRSGIDGFREDFIRLEGTIGLPIELLDSFRLLARSRYEYLDAIVDYNRAQFELYVALGQPPANALAHPVPAEGVNLPPQPAVPNAPAEGAPEGARPGPNARASAGTPPSPAAGRGPRPDDVIRTRNGRR